MNVKFEHTLLDFGMLENFKQKCIICIIGYLHSMIFRI